MYTYSVSLSLSRKGYYNTNIQNGLSWICPMVYQEVVDVPTDVRKLFNILLNQALLIFTPFSFSSFSDWSCYLINHVSISEPSNGEYIVKKFIFDLFFFFFILSFLK